MRAFNSWKWQLKKTLFDGGTFGLKMRPLPFMVVVCTVMLFIVYRTTNYQYRQTELERRLNPFYTLKDSGFSAQGLGSLPQGIINSRSDLELKPLWSSSSSKSKVNNFGSQNLLAIPVGLKQKDNVDIIVRKFLPENFTIILFHYDGNVDGWWDLQWSKKAIHIVGLNQTKWWFAKRFLHPAVVSAYDYIFLWDEDLGVENFHPGRYLKIIKSAGLEISQPALDPNSTGIHHRITIRKRTDIFHKRVYDFRGSVKCSDASDGPPCAGFVEGMAPVFSRAAWICAWHLIQSDLVHGWGMDMKLGYCAQKETYCELAIGVGINSGESTVYDCEGDRTKKVGVVDSEYLVHQSIQTLGGPSTKKASSVRGESIKKHTVDARAEIRRQATSELQEFEDRWDKAVKEDKSWEDPYKASPPNRKRRRRSRRRHSKV